ncbi:MAG: hypothetical protein ACODAJ_07600 [Planctomycetota bacterium]
MKAARKSVVRRWLLLGLAVALAIGAGMFVPSLNRQREELGLIGAAEVGEVSPGLQLLVSASGPVRAVAINVLWMRATRLQEAGEFFELNELCRMITLLEPRLPMVWAHWAWNLAYNVSVKFPADQPEERWRWVQMGVETLRDRGIRHNPKAALLYRELAWIHDHKIGGTSDEAHLYYKVQLALDIQRVLGKPPYQDRLEAIADAPRRVAQLSEPARALLARLNTPGLDPLATPLAVLNRTELPDEAAAALERAKGSPELAEVEAFLRGYHLRHRLKMEPGGVEFARGDVLHWDRLAERLAAAADATGPGPARRLWDLLGEPTRQILKFAAKGNALDTRRRDLVLAGLNQVIARPDLYDERAFARVALPVFAKGYVDAGLDTLDEDQLKGFNRTLLHAAFPEDLAGAGIMLRLMNRYGPIDWRLPDAHSLYWTAAGLDVLGLSVEKAANTDRIAFHALRNLYHRGRLTLAPDHPDPRARWRTAPDFRFIEPVREYYQEVLERYKGTGQEDPVRDGYLNFLRAIIVDLYAYNDLRAAQKYWQVLVELGPESGRLQDFIAQRMLRDVQSPTRDHYIAIIEGHLYTALLHASRGDTEAAAGFQRMARLLHAKYNREHAERLHLPPVRELWQTTIRRALQTFPQWQVEELRRLFPDEVEKALDQLRKEAEDRQKQRRERELREREGRPPVPPSES